MMSNDRVPWKEQGGPRTTIRRYGSRFLVSKGPLYGLASHAFRIMLDCRYFIDFR